MAPLTRAAKRRALQCQESLKIKDTPDAVNKSTRTSTKVDVKSRSHHQVSPLRHDKRTAPPPCSQTKLRHENSIQDRGNEQHHSASRLVLPPLRPPTPQSNIYEPAPLGIAQTSLAGHDIFPRDTLVPNQVLLQSMAQEALAYLGNRISKTSAAT